MRAPRRARRPFFGPVVNTWRSHRLSLSIRVCLCLLVVWCLLARLESPPAASDDAHDNHVPIQGREVQRRWMHVGLEETVSGTENTHARALPS